MKRASIFLLLCILSLIGVAQEPTDSALAKLATRARLFGERIPQEKVFVQMDNTCYFLGDTLSFDAAIEGCEVRLLDEDENIIFSDFIAISQTSLTLPATLTGTFELQIIRGNFIFYCEIEL